MGRVLLPRPSCRGRTARAAQVRDCSRCPCGCHRSARGVACWTQRPSALLVEAASAMQREGATCRPAANRVTVTLGLAVAGFALVTARCRGRGPRGDGVADRSWSMPRLQRSSDRVGAGQWAAGSRPEHSSDVMRWPGCLVGLLDAVLATTPARTSGRMVCPASKGVNRRVKKKLLWNNDLRHVFGPRRGSAGKLPGQKRCVQHRPRS